MKPDAPNVESSVRILKTASCSSMSGKSKLTYQVAYSDDAGILFRISDNSGTGFFSQEWVSLRTILHALNKAQSAKSITSFHLHALFQGKSINTPAFLLAALKNEGVLVPSTTTRRCQELTDGAKFQAEMKGLIERRPSQSGKGGTSKAIKSGAAKAKSDRGPKPTGKVVPKIRAKKR